MSLKAVFDEIAVARKANEWLLPALLEGMVDSREVPPPKATDWFGVSSVPTMCPRAFVMAARMKLSLSRDLGPKERWSMDRGTALHVVMQSHWLGPLGWIMGGWSCPACGHLHGGTGGDRWSVRLSNAVMMPTECGGCGRKRNRQEPFAFVEPASLHVSPLMVRGRNDGFLALPACGIEVMDLKTTSRLDLVRRGPNKDHVEQLQWYMDSEKLRSGRIVYMDPGAKRIEDAFVEHRVSFDVDLMQKQKEKVLALRKALQEEARPVPACPYGGKGTYGECNCVEMALLWARAGH